MNEIWKEIEGYKDLYEVSNLGNVKSFKRYSNGKLMIPKQDKDGYLEVGLRDSYGKRKFYRIHRLVAIAFIPNPDDLDEINHKDNIPCHNFVENLEWCTVQYNNKYRFEHGNANHSCENNPTTKLTNEEVIQIYKLGHSGKYTEPQLAKMYNTTRSVVNKIRLGYRWSDITKNITI